MDKSTLIMMWFHKLCRCWIGMGHCVGLIIIKWGGLQGLQYEIINETGGNRGRRNRDTEEVEVDIGVYIMR